MIRPRLTIGFKILSGFILSALFVGLVGYVGIAGNRKMENALNIVLTHNVPQLEALFQIKSIAAEIEAQTVTLEFIGKETSQTEGSLAGEKKSAILANIEKMDRWVKDYKALIVSNNPDELIYIGNIKDASDEIASSALELITLKESGISGKPLTDKKNELAEVLDHLKESIGIALQEELKHLDEQNKITIKTATDTTNTSVIVTILALLFSLFFGFLISRSISKNVAKVKNAASEISKGNLKEKIIVRSKDEIGELATAFNTMVGNLWIAREALETKNKELENATKQTEEKLAEIETLNKFMVNRELKMIELKKEIEDLKLHVKKTI